MSSISFLTELEAETKRIRDYESQAHKHKPGRTNASTAGKCTYIGACYIAFVSLPITTGLKADTAVLDTGNEFHDTIEYKLTIRFAREPVPNMEFGSEITVHTELYEGMDAYSRIDLCLVKTNGKGGFMEEQFDYKNETRTIKIKNPTAEWIKIGDIKTCGTYAYFKIRKNGLPFDMKAQGHIYMKATGLKEITFMIVNKEKGWKFEIVCKWDDRIWEEVVRRAKRKHEIADAIINNQNIAIDPRDLECLDAKGIGWYSCPLSITHEDERSSGQPELVLDEVCDLAKEYMKFFVNEKVKLGSMWKRGKAIITINVISEPENLIVSTNLSGTQYRDTYCYAYMNFEPYVEEKKK